MLDWLTMVFFPLSFIPHADLRDLVLDVSYNELLSIDVILAEISALTNLTDLSLFYYDAQTSEEKMLVRTAFGQ
jgi:hypothetical protein